MTLRSLPYFLSILLISSCSVKEDRDTCPCRLTIDLSDASKADSSVLVTAKNGSGELYTNDVSRLAQESILISVPKGYVEVFCLQGTKKNMVVGRNVFIPEGCDTDSLMISTDLANCLGETAFSKASFHKNWTNLTISFSKGDGTDCPYGFVIEGEVNGIDIETITPLYGPFRCNARPITGEDAVEVNLPRQPEELNTLHLNIMDKSDNSLRVSYNLSELLKEMKYDWTTSDLNDVRMHVDHAGLITDITVLNWQTGCETEVVI